MKKLLGIVVMALLWCNVGVADLHTNPHKWTEFGNLEDNKGKYYVDKDSMVEDAGYLIFWKMVDFIEPIKSTKYYSVRIFIKGDCKMNRIKSLVYVYYIGSKATGESDIKESTDKRWKYPTPEKIDSIILSKLCL